MKDDYLWNKTGNDLEIEKLENALRVFRFEENEPPQIQATILNFKQNSTRKVFPVFRFLAASFIIAFISAGIWFVQSDPENEFASIQIEDFPLQNENPKNAEPENSGIHPQPKDKKFLKNKEIVKTNFQKQNIEARKSVSNPKIKPQIIHDKNSVIKLTEEEKEAFEKLMLALSITSSKLKIVKDKIQNLDGQTAINIEIDKRKK